MKRSRVNGIMRETCQFLASRQFHLPPFAFWTSEDWQNKLPYARQIVDRRLGWDVTDFGSGSFDNEGLVLFTLRNGTTGISAQSQSMVYSEKVLVVSVKQVTPMHFHMSKTEDIINRGGGTLAIELHNSYESNALDSSDVAFFCDGIEHKGPAGTIHRLDPGESITLPPRLFHSFWAEQAPVLAGEVSSVNDDERDNHFLEPVRRFATIDEDEPSKYLLVSDYARILG